MRVSSVHVGKHTACSSNGEVIRILDIKFRLKPCAPTRKTRSHVDKKAGHKEEITTIERRLKSSVAAAAAVAAEKGGSSVRVAQSDGATSAHGRPNRNDHCSQLERIKYEHTKADGDTTRVA